MIDRDDEYSDDCVEIPSDLEEMEISKITSIEYFENDLNPDDIIPLSFIKETNKFEMKIIISSEEKKLFVFKSLKPGYSDDDIFSEIIKPMQILDQIKNESFVRFFEYGIPKIPNSFLPWIKLEYIPGWSLHDIIKYSKEIDEIDIFKIIYRLALIIKDMHEKDITNLSLNPDNIIITNSKNHPFPIICTHSFQFKQTDIGEKSPYELLFFNPNFMLDDNNLEQEIIFNDLYAFGLIVFLLINSQKNNLSRHSFDYERTIDKINKTFNEFKNEKTKHENLIDCYINYFKSLNLNLEIENKNLSLDYIYEAHELAKKCIFNEIKSASELFSALDNIVKNHSYIYHEIERYKNDITNIDNVHNNIGRGEIKDVKKSVADLTPRDMKMIINYEKIFGKDFTKITQLSLIYASITNDYSLYMEALESNIIQNKFDNSVF